jgi:diguanylate cyclase
MEEATETAEVRIEEQRRIALTDSLTQIPNREAYNQRGTQELARWQRYERPLCLAICDIDLFKNVNDTYGHAAGDEVLKGVGEVLQQRMRESDFVSRYGGEEFVVLLTETEKEQAFHVMESVRESICSSSYAWGEEKLSVTISIGIAEFRGKDSLESVFTRADRALYRAKDCGRNQSLLAE